VIIIKGLIGWTDGDDLCQG